MLASPTIIPGLHRNRQVNFIAILFAIAGAVVAVFYGLESYLSFQAKGFSAALLL